MPNYLNKNSTRLRNLRIFYEKPVVQISLELLLSLLAVIILAVFALRPTFVTIGSLLKTIQDQKQVVEQLETKKKNLNTAQSNLNTIADEIPKLDQALPAKSQAEILIRQIESASSDLKVSISQLSVGKIILINSHTEVPDITAAPENAIASIPVSLTIEASYEETLNFISSLSNMTRVIRIKNLTLKNEGESDNIVTTDLDIEAYLIN